MAFWALSKEEKAKFFRDDSARKKTNIPFSG